MKKLTGLYREFNRWMSLVYVVGALLFFFAPSQVFYIINIGPKVLGIGEAVPESSEHFWLVLSSSMMMMLALLCFQCFRNPSNRDALLVHTLSKGTSTLGFLWMFLNHKQYFSYIAGIITDLPLFVLTLYFVMSPTARTTSETAADESLK